MKYKELPSIEILNQRLRYDADTGKLINKIRTKSAVKDEEAGTSIGKGYRAVWINNERYLYHRVIWKLITGEDPGDSMIDHIDRDPSNNRINNLRLTTKDDNQRNRLGKGVYRDMRRKSKPWRAQITVKGKRMTSVHECPLMARQWYLDMKIEHHPTYSHK